MGCSMRHDRYPPLATLGIIHLLIADSSGIPRPPFSFPPPFLGHFRSAIEEENDNEKKIRGPSRDRGRGRIDRSQSFVARRIDAGTCAI